MLATIKSSHVIQFGQVHMHREHWSNVEKLVQQIGEIRRRRKNLNLMKSVGKVMKIDLVKRMFGKRYPNCVKKEEAR